MKTAQKSDGAYKTIGEVARELNLIDKKSGNLQTHTIRYWETKFKQIKPTIKAGKRRYFSQKDFKIVKYIKFLLKEKGHTINGVKKILNENKNHFLDDNINFDIHKPRFETTKVIKNRIKNISNIIKQLKKYK